MIDPTGANLLKYVSGNRKKEWYKCCDCELVFDEYEAAYHFGNTKAFQADMLACPECDSEDLEDYSEGEEYDRPQIG